MGKLQVFDILLDNPIRVYQAGQVVSGSVVVEMNEPMKVRGVRLEFHGGASVHWTEKHSTGSGKNRRTHTRHYSADETYFHFEIVLFGKASGQGGDNPHHPTGRHIYPFQYTLPTNLPSSFEGSVGRVRYWLKGIIDKPWKFDHTCKRAFTINSILDLNTQPNVLTPQQNQNYKTLCCCCCKSGPISGVLRIDRRGYVPGECITLQGEVDNNSNRKMTCSKVQLRMTIAYHATTKTRSESKKISEIIKGEIPPGGSEVWSGEQIQIPSLPPSDLVFCRIIDIQYSVVLIVDPSGPSFDLEVPLVLLIGTVPLQNMFNWYQGPTAALPSAPPPQPSTYPTAPPPSYSQCVFGEVSVRDEDDNEHTRGDSNWAPVYPYFTYGEPPKPASYHSMKPVV